VLNRYSANLLQTSVLPTCRMVSYLVFVSYAVYTVVLSRKFSPPTTVNTFATLPSDDFYFDRDHSTGTLLTPVGPSIMKDAIGRFSPDSPARCNRIAFATAVSASSWPFTYWRRLSSM
jgi:hypothetical protein